MIKEAIRLLELGYNVVFTTDPKKPRGKAPIGKWREWTEKPQTEKDVQQMYDYAKTQDNSLGLAVICTNGLEVIDIDCKYFLDRHNVNDVFDRIIDSIGTVAFKSLVMAETISGGYHLIYRTDVIEGNQKLASRDTEAEEKKDEFDNVRVLLETRAKGGIFVVSPTEGYSFDNPKHTLEHVVKITNSQRNGIIATCIAFDELGEKPKQLKSPPKKIDSSQTEKGVIESFKEAHTCGDVLEGGGWQFSHKINLIEYYVRPGKDLRDGIGAAVFTDTDKAWVFTTSSNLPDNTSLDAVALYSHLHHQGDLKAACKELYHMGFGSRSPILVDNHTKKLEIATTGTIEEKVIMSDDSVMTKIFNERFDITIKPVSKPSTLFLKDHATGEYVGIGGDGEIVTFLGLQKTRKSAIASCAASCFLSGGTNESLLFRALDDGRNLIHIDTEQGETDYYNTCKEMLWQQGFPSNTNAPNFYSYRLTNYSLLEKVQYLEWVLNEVGNVSCIFLDGIVDLCSDYNNLKESQALVGHIRRLMSVHRCLLINVLHNARSTGKARGHLGTEILNKGKCNMTITKDKDAGFSKLEIDDLRGAREPSPFEFTHTDDGHLILDLF